jgi:hypothetical protein
LDYLLSVIVKTPQSLEPFQEIAERTAPLIILLSTPKALPETIAQSVLVVPWFAGWGLQRPALANNLLSVDGANLWQLHLSRKGKRTAKRICRSKILVRKLVYGQGRTFVGRRRFTGKAPAPATLAFFVQRAEFFV